jgi:hypothetical protein
VQKFSQSVFAAKTESEKLYRFSGPKPLFPGGNAS